MLKFTITEPEKILILEPNASLEATDFHNLANQVTPYVTNYGRLPGLMVHAKAFPGWANLDAFSAHMWFVKRYLRNVSYFAIVSDSVLLTEVAQITGYLTDVAVKHYPNPEYDAALQWLKIPGKTKSPKSESKGVFGIRLRW